MNARLSTAVRALATACALLTVVLCWASAASAYDWATEQVMVNTDWQPARDTFIADPGIGKRWDRRDLVAQHLGYYRAHGFANILLWAPLETYDAGSEVWFGCHGAHVGACADNDLVHGPVDGDLGDTHLIALQWQHAFIAMGCGNFSGLQLNGPTPTISGAKFEDTNGNGARDPGEPGLSGWTIQLLQHGSVLMSTQTDANGNYAFALDANALPIDSEDFEVREVQQPGWVASRTPGTIHVPFGSAEQRFGGNDFGNYRPATIEGVKFDDHDVDRLRGSADQGLPDWSISLSGGRSPDATTTTAPDGSYRFTGLVPGTYTIAETPQAHWRQSAPESGTHTITVRSGDVAGDADFGNVCLGNVEVAMAGQSEGLPVPGTDVRIEEVDVPGVLSNDPALPRTGTAPVTFSDLLPGTYRVIMFLPAHTYTTDPDLRVVDHRLAIVRRITVGECTTTPVRGTVIDRNFGKVTGGMKMELPGGYATAGFQFQTKLGVATGTLEYVDHRPELLDLHTDQIEAIWVAGNDAWIGGLIAVDGASEPFVLHLVDQGEPGTDDHFELTIANGYRVGFGETIEGGNDQVHPPEPAV